MLIETKFGTLRGGVEKNVLGGEYLSFKGIPYAEPPVGNLRFQDPQPWSRKWTNIRDAIEHGDICAQFDRIISGVTGSDDCLYLNVYTKSVENNIPFPVMVWIHGGGFIFGSGNDDIYGPDFLVRKEIVLVTINYRIDVLGFLNLGLETAPGNQGLKDQVMALKWVKDNISNFGGDPNNVTIFGESAGSASVHYLTQSTLANGLFHKAIAQSGTALNPWTHMCENPSIYAFKLASLLGCESSDRVKIVEFLRTVDSIKLITVQQKIITKEERLRFQFTSGPSVDSASKNPFLPRPISIDNLTEIKVPFLIGHNSREGLMFLAGMQEKIYQVLDLNFADYLPPTFRKWLIEKNLTPEDLRSFYFGDAPINSESAIAYADFTSDVQFVCGIHEVVKLQGSKNKNTYLYKFSYDPGPSFMKKVVNVDKPGTCHFDEIPYLFHMIALDMLGLETPTKNAVKRKIMERFTKMWTDFAKTGNPTPSKSELIPVTWDPVDDKIKFRSMNIDENIKMEIITSYEERLATRRKLRNKL
ncbi:esterase FE4-like isoform X2 [Belonocnema kinseyi]|uniref:esterase FE4-like isoform X2 n=1 Tax=Belonocnema kinseyi TaxID=2817044 RepID=UPI00143DA82B|nr:esterase FE4-like isoform X2 [Belonocnema kinseyi]XP_033219239.1 esterase FE4-like isoform X2 [Belonocnema kinseyi]XP_033219240.1 esterase FE4-like isoform X2 [Belonocnema kinseyi]